MLEGVFPIVATPFRDDGSPDLADLARLVDFIVGAGVDGIVFPGVASEFETLKPTSDARWSRRSPRRTAGACHSSSACRPPMRRPPRRWRSTRRPSARPR
jgi:hypothetical protein